MSESFLLKIENYVAELSFNRPQKANSLNEDSGHALKENFERLDADPNVRVIILSGEGKHFCAGIDLETLMSVQTGDETCQAKKNLKIRSFIKMLQESISSIERCRKPVLAAVHNGCIGGGVDIIAACDIRYCTSEAYFTIKEIDLGLVADIGTLQRLPTILNPGIMAEMAYTGRKVYGPEAKEIGLVNNHWANKEAMMAEVRTIARMIASKSPLCVRGTKEMLLYKRDHSVRDSLDNMANYNSAMLISEDLMEAFQASMMKREATFKD